MTINLGTSYWEYLIYAVLMLAAIFLVSFIFKKVISFFKRPELHGLNREGIKKQWDSIEELVSRKEETAWKLAVMEADKLLDHVLKSMAIPGLNLGERLRFVEHKYPKIRNVWPAHKVRNRLVHEAGYHLNRNSAQRAI
ncbi:MAG: hypothetical protein HQ536_03775, partial [Parcubacteria group bacterium]|nr:hypothetical protein [Parcubacteria group bacterium]